MPKYASKSARGFFSSEIHGDNMPADAVEISKELYLTLMSANTIDWSEDMPVPVAAPSPDTVAVPLEVTRYQALAALHIAGKLEAVEAMMADPATDTLTVLAWKNAQEFKRTSPMVLNMAQALGLSEQQVDDLFIAASQIE